ncbi:MAG: FAD-dependent oxidoreductase [Pseudomonadota bacterium]
MRFDSVIVGAGLSGLAVARSLLAKGETVALLEARDRAGGRILTRSTASAGGAGYDLGPAWIWPHNTRMLKLISEFGLPLMRQHAAGKLVFQDQNGSVRRDLDFATMGEALRVEGGLARITDSLERALPEGVLRLGHVVKTIEASDPAMRLTGQNDEGTFSVEAERMILALPPRIAASNLEFLPALPVSQLQSLRSVPTWMAGHAKFVAVYERAHWREAGFSGDAISHLGPLFEIHDASADPDASGGAALFGFVAPNRAGKDCDETRLIADATRQLADLFGPALGAPSQIFFTNWANDPYTATELDAADLSGHPRYGRQTFADPPWAGRVFFAGTETAPENGGFLEGALEAAEQF